MTDAEPFRCSAASRLRDDQLVGTATHLRAFLLVEHPGPWGEVALRDTALPGNLLAGLRRRSASTGVRVLLMRRHRQRGQDGVRVFAACVDAARPWLETAVLADHHDVLDLDLESLGEGRSPGLERHPEPVFGVCTQGRHDACCAERGRPVAAALAATHPGKSWEVSHLGGDRFAANLLVLGDGLGYGRLDAETAPQVADAHLAGLVTPEYFRGRAGFTMPVQAAELAVRRALDEWRVPALRLVGRPDAEGETRRVRFEVDQANYEVTVRRTMGVPVQLTCSALRDNPLPTYTPGTVTEVR